MTLNFWDEILSEERAQMRAKAPFLTHANYVDYLKDISKGLKLDFGQKHTNQFQTFPESGKKKNNLIKFTYENLIKEFDVVKSNPEYAEVSISWLPVKSYYLLYGLFINLDYLLKGDAATFTRNTHTGVLNKIREYIKDSTLKFNKQEFNEVYTISALEKISLPKWHNIRYAPDRKYAILKKLVDYSKEEFKRSNRGLKRLTGDKKAEFETSELSLIDFFYWYRVKVNYRDVEFLNADLSQSEIVTFYCNYFHLTINYYSALKEGINELAMIRLGKNLL